MKKIFAVLVLFLFALNANAAMTFDQAFSANDTKPMAVLIYADWSNDKDGTLERFRNLSQQMGNKYNYVEINISKAEAQSYMETYQILSKLPYVMLYRSKCKFARYIDRDCTSSVSCMVSKMQTFMR